jgi:Asp-tRNA(Asn)/Glu-tRNA(Gln) amidotransferase A subunit family amidase
VSLPHRAPSGPGPGDAFVVGPADCAGGEATGPLSGVRAAVKDLFDLAGTRTGAGNPDWLEDAPVADRHAVPVAALLAAGARIVGKTVTDELAFSLSGTNVHYGTPPNPAAPGRVPGGSSSGSASAVASGIVELALGTDTAGSVRVPASYCGLYGIRPTHGSLSRQGVFLLAPSFCTVGLLARSGAVLAAGWSALTAGAGEAQPPPAPATAGRPLGRLVVVPELLALADASARASIDTATGRLAAELGVALEVGTLGGQAAVAAYCDAFRTLQMAEVWQRHGAWITARSPRLGPGIAARFAAAAGVAAEQVPPALERRERLRTAMALLLGDDGYLVQPAAAGAAPPIGLAGAAKDEMRARTLQLTAPASLAGAPVVVMPLADDRGLPVGVALVGRPGDDAIVARCAAQSRPAAGRRGVAPHEPAHGREANR